MYMYRDFILILDYIKESDLYFLKPEYGQLFKKVKYHCFFAIKGEHMGIHIPNRKKISRIITSLAFRLPFLFIASSMIALCIMLSIQYNKLEQRMVNDYSIRADGITKLIANSIDTDRIDEYIEENFSSEEYMNTIRYLYTLKENFPDIYYLYVYKITPQGAVVIFDLDDELPDVIPQESIDWVGSIYELDEPFASHIDELMSGKKDLYYAVHTKDNEYLLSYVSPILDSDGNYAASACVDFSMNVMHIENIHFTASLTLLLLAILGLIIYICIDDLNRVVIYPINNLINCIHSFKYDTYEDRSNNVKMLEQCELHIHNQIEELRNTLLTSMKDTETSYQELSSVKDEINEITAIVRKDALTHVGSKAYYDEFAANLENDMRKQKVEYAVLMVDLNNLKKINDTYGHEKGNEFIINCSKIVCRIYKGSPVFRIGGDEFVVILQGEDYRNRHKLLKRLRAEFNESYNDASRQEYERYSASTGMADYDPERDRCVEDTFKRSDNMMYNDKNEFKTLHGSYR